MRKVLILLKLCYKFSLKYLFQYIKALIKPAFIALIGVLFTCSVYLNPYCLILGIAAIPMMCYAFWKGYVITYSLIPCAHCFIKETSRPFYDFIVQTKQQEKEFIKYIGFVAVLTLLFYIPAILYIIKTVPFSIDMLIDSQLLLTYTKIIDNAFFVNTLFLAPFLNYLLCVYYYRKDNENYFQLFLNNYRRIDIIGVILALVITLLSYKGGVIYIVLAVFLNPFIYSLNTFYYLSRIKK